MMNWGKPLINCYETHPNRFSTALTGFREINFTGTSYCIWQVFERNNTGIDEQASVWDGKFKGQFVETGTYIYLAKMECISGEIFTFKGTVTLVK